MRLLHSVIMLSPLLQLTTRRYAQGSILLQELARVCGVPVCRRLGSRLATTLVATKKTLFSFLVPLSTFLIEGALGSKNLFRES